MRLRALKIERFGHFADLTLPLDGGGVQVVYGENEAGKSTLLAALRALLFGFPRATWDFRFPSETLALGGVVRFADGSEAELRREKGRGLRGRLGEVHLGEPEWRARLGRPSEVLYSSVFAFALADLAAGGAALRDDGLKAALAGAGVSAARSPHALIRELGQRADALFTEKARQKPINAALAELKRAHEARRAADLRGEDYRRRRSELVEAEADAAARGNERAAALKRLGALDALVRALPRRDELRGARALRDRLAPPPLGPEAGAEYRRWLDERAHLDERARDLGVKQERLARETEALVVSEPLRRAHGRIAALSEQLGRHAQETEELAALEATLGARRLELGRQLGELRPGWTLAELDVLPHPLFTSSLERLREGWSGQRERAAELERLGREAARLDEELVHLRRRLDPPWPLDDARRALPVPRVEEVKRQRGELARHDQAVAELDREEERLRAERRRLEGERERLERDGAVPSPDELLRRRGQRDALVAALRRAPAPTGDDAWADLAAAIRAADEHADELRRRSHDVAARAEIELRLRDSERARGDVAARRERAQAERATARAGWRALWERTGFEPQSPEAMLEWLQDHAEHGARAAEAEARAARLGSLAAAQDDYARRVAAIMTALGLDPGLDLGLAKRVIDVVLAVRSELEILRRDDERLRRLAASTRQFRDAVARLAHDLRAPAEADAVRALRALDEAARASEDAARRRAVLAAQAAEVEAERAALSARRGEAARALAAWQKRAGVDEDDAFLAAAEAARQAHELDREIERLERALAEARGATPAAEFAAALESAERAVVEASQAEARRALAAAESTLAAAHVRVGSARASLALVDDGAGAAELTLRLESRRAELRGYVGEYAVLALARALLERQVERFQERHQPALVAELTTLFAALTGGRYPRVYQRLDEHGSFVAVRSDGVEVTPEGLSTGAREQLYLALRLAYVRHYCRTAEPLPLVLDDVLVNFDAARARATLAVLHELARETQVLLFTCHPHVVALAREQAVTPPIELPPR